MLAPFGKPEIYISWLTSETTQGQTKFINCNHETLSSSLQRTCGEKHHVLWWSRFDHQSHPSLLTIFMSFMKCIVIAKIYMWSFSAFNVAITNERYTKKLRSVCKSYLWTSYSSGDFCHMHRMQLGPHRPTSIQSIVLIVLFSFLSVIFISPRTETGVIFFLPWGEVYF